LSEKPSTRGFTHCKSTAPGETAAPLDIPLLQECDSILDAIADDASMRSVVVKQIASGLVDQRGLEWPCKGR